MVPGPGLERLMVQSKGRVLLEVIQYRVTALIRIVT